MKDVWSLRQKVSEKQTIKMLNSIPSDMLLVISNHIIDKDVWTEIDSVMALKLVCKKTCQVIPAPGIIKDIRKVMDIPKAEPLQGERCMLNRNFPRQKPKREKIKVLFREGGECETWISRWREFTPIVCADHTRGTTPGRVIYYYVSDNKFVRSRRLLSVVRHIPLETLKFAMVRIPSV